MLRDTPPLLLAQKVLRRLPFKPMDVGRLCFLRYNGVPQVRPALLRGSAMVRPAVRDDLDALVRLRDQRSTFLDRFDAGDDAVVAEVDGRIVGFEWFCDQPRHREGAWGYDIAVPDGFTYAYDAFIDPAYRNTGIWLRFKAYLADHMRRRAGRGVLTFVEYGNWPSWRTHLRFGFEPAESVTVVKVLGRLIVL
jgi:GNAT superfamily N-acetyltransferase